MAKSIYIHIPFCEHICYYCDFNKVFLQNQPVDEYLDALETEIKNSLEKFKTEGIKTVFVGGGTPTALNAKQLERLTSIISTYILPLTTNGLEYTFESNPGDLPSDKLQVLKDGKVERLSFGVQTFNDELLQKIGRSHKAKDVFETIESAQAAGFSNINVDLIYSLPSQEIKDFKETLRTALKLGVQHFSGYSLQIEPKTVFYNLVQRGKLRLPPEEREAQMYELLMVEMEKNGYHQYEISNFSQEGFESKHNITYWNNNEYFGFGAGAHSYVDGVRRVNAGPLSHYINRINNDGFPYIEEHLVTLEERMEEEMFLGLRKTDGVSKPRFYERYGKHLNEVFGSQINEYKQKQLLKETEDRVYLTKEGFFLGNEVFQSFLA
ncbi:radical SAM family heme chaperone HemW [Bacillus solimangrovi]|uniref:Heme chaperone HemW n=1 Tax=Bacillus solimangrovi TaxID=1305675 RepID=A0A1E5LHZ6_9BACI|nr:radical SAM family heme chaperone HemW [Bacillus solimangrovi]OEH93688.1 coproporphyrinogen III oxidase [Bacillus solimangrovi]